MHDELCIVVYHPRNGKLYISDSIVMRVVIFMPVYTVDEVEITSRLDSHENVDMEFWPD